MADNITKLTGGPKNMFLRQHRETILDCLDIFGEDWVKQHFNLGAHFYNTLEELKHREDKRMSKPGKIDYLELRLEGLASQVHENKKAIEELKGLFQEFVESTSNQICRTFLIPLLRNVLNFEGNLPERIDELNIEGLLQQVAPAKKQLLSSQRR